MPARLRLAFGRFVAASAKALRPIGKQLVSLAIDQQIAVSEGALKVGRWQECNRCRVEDLS
jgi:hypothetical protein